MKFKAILSRSTTDQVKSKLLSPQACQLVFDVYMRPEEFAELVNEFFDYEFEIELKRVKI